MIGRVISHYRLDESVSHGGMGAVYKARDLTLERTVAIKVLEPSQDIDRADANRLFLREAQVISQIDHPNVVTLFEVIHEEDCNFMVMQYVPGSTLRDVMSEKPLGYLEAIRIACEVGSGLRAAHELDIVHRDIKPENIMVTPKGLCKILDFGVARLVGRSTITEKGKIIGTLPYMAPEQIQGEQVDTRTDIYALGVLLFEMLSGRLPFDQVEEAALFYQITNVDPPSLRSLRPEIPENLETVVSKALRKNPSERYQSIEEMLHDLELIRSGLVDRYPSRERLYARKALARRPSMWAGVVLLAAILILLINYIRFDSSSPREEPRIMVMKWENTQNDEELAWLSSAIMDGLITSLGDLAGFRVITRQTVSSVVEILRSKAAGFSTSSVFGIARQVGADYLVAGSFAMSRDSLRIDCRLDDLEKRVLVETWSRYIGNLDRELFTSIDAFAGNIAAALGADWKRGSAVGRQARGTSTRSLEALKYYENAMEYYEVGNMPASAENFKRAVEADPGFTAAHLYLGRVSTELSDREKHLTLAMEHRHASPSPLREIVEADFMVFNGANEEAIEKYEDILGLYPEEVTARVNLATLYQRSRRFHEAVAEYVVLSRINPFDYSFYPVWWMAYIEIGRKEKALHILEGWRRHGPNEERPLRELIRFHQTQGDYKAALAFCDTLSRLRPGADLSRRGFLYADMGRMTDAEDIFIKLKDNPDPYSPRHRAYSWLAYLYYRKGDCARGLKFIEQALENDKGIYNHWIAGLLAAGNGELERGERYAQEIKKTSATAFEDTTAPEALAHRRFYYDLRGSIALASKNAPLAIEMYEKALKFSSKIDEAFFRTHLGEAYLEAGETRKAVTALERVLRLNAHWPDALLHLSRAYIALGEHEKALSCLVELDHLLDDADDDYAVKRELKQLIALASSHR